MVEAYVDAFTTQDVSQLVAILSDDVWLKMPPLPFEYHWRDAAIEFFESVVLARGRTVRFVHTHATGGPASGMYVLDSVTGTWRANGLIVIGFAGDRVSEITR